MSFSCRVHDERYYQTIFFVTFLLLGTTIEAEARTNEGRIDAFIRSTKDVYLLEFKQDKSADRALAQIAKHHYYEKFRASGLPLVMVGVNFNLKKGRIDDWNIDTIR